MFENKDIDGIDMNLRDVLNEIVGCGLGIFLIFEKGKIVYYESEEIKERYIGICLNWKYW